MKPEESAASTVDQSPRRPGRPAFTEMADGERRAHILRAAIELFGRRGFASVSLNVIAESVGVSRAALLHHFGSKEALFAVALTELFAMIAEAIQDLVRGPGTVPDRIHALIDESMHGVDSDADLDTLLRDVRQHLPAAERTRINEAHGRVLSVIEQLMREGIERGDLARQDPRLLAYFLWRLMASFGDDRETAAGLAATNVTARDVTAMFLSGARGPHPGHG